MAKASAVWGIDIGQCALKALRCRPHEKDEHRIVVEAFDYIEYPKILTQPEANREELIREALQQFVSRNDVTGDHVAIAVPGQSGLARFIKLPPVERKKIPDIVKYEARQQIPFALEDVVWDYQPLVGAEEEGYALETEVGLFAMKRDQVARALKPLEEASVAVDTIQLAPLAIYNFICFDRLKIEGPYDPANPPPSTVIISMGTDTTDLVITNGYRVWQRSIPIGGNHFTKALTKELKLTFAKAEHLKRNAMKAENPKAVFQAMRPVFSDLVAEIQRSIGFFTSNNRNAKLGDVIALGNPMKLPGLQRYLSQNLDQDVKLVDSFNNLVGGSATAGPQFKENQLTFGVAYGLCVQALERGQLRTNLLPEEIVTTRLVRAKKPWVVAAVALLLVALTINYFGHYAALLSANVDDPNMQRAINNAKQTVTQVSTLKSEHDGLISKFDEITKIGNNLQSNVDGRLLWLELLKAIDAALPKDPRPPEERAETAEDVARRPELHITSMDCEFYPDVAPWYNSIRRFYEPSTPEAAPAGTGAAPDAEGAETDEFAPPDEAFDADADGSYFDSGAEVGDAGYGGEADGAELGSVPATGRSGPGWIIELRGYHLHNSLPGQREFVEHEADRFIINTFFKNLETGTVMLPDGNEGPDGQPELVEVPIADLGIRYPTVVTRWRTQTVKYLAESTETGSMGLGPRGPMEGPLGGGRGGRGRIPPGMADEPQAKTWDLRRYDFIIQFCWQPQPRGQRRERLAARGGTPPAATATAADAARADTGS